MIDIKLRGLSRYQASLTEAERKLDDAMPELESELADSMASEARSKARKGSKSGNAAGSIRAMGPVVSAGIGVDYYGFFDFGGRVGRKKSVRRDYIRGGRYLFPAIREVGVRRRAEKFIDRTTKELQ